MENTELFHNLMCCYKKDILGASRVLAKEGVTLAQMDILCGLNRHPGQTQQELAQSAHVTKGNMTQILSKMEQQELVERQVEKHSKTVYLTEKAKKLYVSLAPFLEEYHRDFFSVLTVEEKMMLATLLRKLL